MEIIYLYTELGIFNTVEYGKAYVEAKISFDLLVIIGVQKEDLMTFT